MALTSRRDAEVFARLLDGERPAAASAELESLAELARALPRPGVGPDPQFVARLRTELVTAAEQRASLLPRQVTAASLREPASRPSAGPRTIEVRFPRRLVPTLAATLVGLAVLVMGLSSRALPGDRLYDVKLGIGQAQVRLAGSDLDRGRALLRQVDHRLDEVDALVGAGDPRAAQVDVALTQATTDLADAQRVLLSAGDGTADPEALQALADASVQALGRLKALEPLLPSGSGPELRRLLDLLATGQQMLIQQVTACGAPCADLRDDLRRVGIVAGAGGVAGSSSAVGTGAIGSTAPPPASLGVPTAPTAGGGLPLPSATTTPPAPGVPAPTVTAPGVTAPGVTASVPGVGVTVPGATVTTGSGGLPSVTLPPVEATIGPLTASVSVPAIGPTSSSPSPTSSSCVLAVGGLCVG
ncbi:MAG: DUF5667 domain-containing protein [Angustibacter sp.]